MDAVELPQDDEYVDRPAAAPWRRPRSVAASAATVVLTTALVVLSTHRAPSAESDAFALAQRPQLRQGQAPPGALAWAPVAPAHVHTAFSREGSEVDAIGHVDPVSRQNMPGKFSAATTGIVGAVSGAGLAAVRRVFGHKLQARRSQSPMAEIAFCTVLYGAVRSAVRGWDLSLGSFQLRDELFQEMAVAHTYKNSVWPWIQTGGVALVAAVFICVGVKVFMKSMKDWESKQELKEMSALGEDAYFLASTPVDATPLEKKKKKAQRKKMSLPMRALSIMADWLFLLRVGACVGYLLPLLNVLDFGEISVSLYPYALGVPPSEPIVNFMQNTLKLKYLYNAYLKSGYYFLIVWFIFIQVAVRNKAAPFYVRFHSSQAILISMLLGVPQQVFFAVLNPWEAGLMVQSFMYYSMVSLFLFVLTLVAWCCCKALCKRTMTLPLVSEAAVMWAGKEQEGG